MNGDFVCGEVCCPRLYAAHLPRAMLCKLFACDIPKRQAAPKTTACDIPKRQAAPKTTACDIPKRQAAPKTPACDIPKRQAAQKTTACDIPKRQAAPKTTACDILLRPGYPFTPFNSVQLRSKGGWFFSRGHRACLACRGVELRSNRRRAGYELVTNGDYRACLPSHAQSAREDGRLTNGEERSERS